MTKNFSLSPPREMSFGYDPKGKQNFTRAYVFVFLEHFKISTRKKRLSLSIKKLPSDLKLLPMRPI